MVETKHNPEIASNEIDLKEIVRKTQDLFQYLKKKWLIIFGVGVIGGAIAFVYAVNQKPQYIAVLTFALEDEKSGGGGGLAGALNIASSLGIDLGTSAGGAFSGANLIELMKSRTLVEKALLNPIVINKQEQSLASFFIQFNYPDKQKEFGNVSFKPLSNRATFTLQQDSILGVLYYAMVGPNGVLNVSQRDKKISILNIEVRSTNELFSKVFTESIAKEVSTFYVDTKSRKAQMNASILQHQVDSVRNELNQAITGVAQANDNTYNLNPSLNIKRTPSARRQVDVQANTAILTQLVANLEMAKVTLRRETPLIQVIDKPILPLKKEKVSKLKSLFIGTFAAVFLFVACLIARRVWRNALLQ